ncbi:MAG: hypothetical protein ABSC45_12650 [Desulfobaccales bacterium]|jgi:hypothetical protein
MTEQQPETIPKRPPSICAIISISAFGVGLLTPQIFSFLPFLIAIIMGIVSLARKEPLYGLGLASLIASILFLVAVQVSLNNISTSIEKIGTDLSASLPRPDTSYTQFVKIEKVDFDIDYGNFATFRATVRNNGAKVVTQLKANVEVYNNKDQMVHSATIIDFGDIYPGAVKQISTISQIPKSSKRCRIFITEVIVKPLG